MDFDDDVNREGSGIGNPRVNMGCEEAGFRRPAHRSVRVLGGRWEKEEGNERWIGMGRVNLVNMIGGVLMQARERQHALPQQMAN